ncbi:MAG: Bifunctional oligoribonuclease and PAP phosphatase NrnA [Firmicutes bacterium ADurb.Bin300]|nr:MAG: Bifunctional oligoribonuclease and PAP phosphatase NrnA [Firmicutes bacterium ADurb.Bin300]
MRINKKEFAEKLRQGDNILILMHEQPDGDAMGCAYALYAALKKLGKKSRVSSFDEPAHNLRFIAADIEFEKFEPDLIVAVDVADLKLLGDNWRDYEGKIDLCLDHHVSNTEYARYTFLEDTAAASEMVYDVIRELGVEIDHFMAVCIYVGVATDTGCFRYPNTTSRTIRIAADMMDKGIDAQDINKLMFETKTKSFVKLEKLVNETLELHFDDRCAIYTITRKMFEKSGALESECHPITAASRQIEGVLVGAVIKEQKDGSFNISVRTNGSLNAADICAELGGGGHKNASGCELGGTLAAVKAALLKSIERALGIEA